MVRDRELLVRVAGRRELALLSEHALQRRVQVLKRVVRADRLALRPVLRLLPPLRLLPG